jgi:predicted dehydrogenase
MKILIAGLGGIGQRHFRNLITVLGDPGLIRAVDPRPNIPVLTDKLQVEANATLEGKYGLEIYPDLDAGLSWHPDAVFICTPTSMHIPTALSAVHAGCHVFIEKPLSHNLEKVDVLLEQVEKHRLLAFMGYQMRFHPSLKRLHELMIERKIGNILSVRADIGEYLPGWHTYEDYRQMYASRLDLGGGVILSQIHEMDYLYWMFGLPTSIYTLGGQLSQLELDVEDTAEILMNFSAEKRSYPVSLHVDYVQRPPSRSCQVLGDSGKITLDLVNPVVTVYDEKGMEIEKSSYLEFQRNEMFLNEVSSFLDALAGKSTPLVGLRDGMQSLRMAMAAKESLSTGKVVELKRK